MNYIHERMALHFLDLIIKDDNTGTIDKIASKISKMESDHIYEFICMLGLAQYQLVGDLLRFCPKLQVVIDSHGNEIKNGDFVNEIENIQEENYE